MKKVLLLTMPLWVAVFIAEAQPKKTLMAGPDQTINSTDSAHLVGTSIGIRAVLWITNGTGTFSNQDALETDYFPSAADILKGNVVLTLTDGKKKVKESDPLNLTINSACATVSAGRDTLICAYTGGALQLVANSENYSSITWSTNGYGEFDDIHSLSPAYYYHQGDINLGSIEIYATVQSTSCDSDTDTLTISLQGAPQLEFPEPSVQEIDYVGVTASVNISGPVSNGLWTSTGSGYFADPGATVTAYYPSPEDRVNGCVQLIFSTEDPEGVCGAASGSMFACFTPTVACPELSVGGDITICAFGGDQVYLQATIGGSADGLYWSSNGAGYFDDQYSPTAVYNVDASDINNAQIEIYATISNFDCYVSDALTLYLNAGPELVFPEPFIYTCAGTPIGVNVYPYGYASGGYWSSTGTGSFDNANSSYATYTPGPGEVGSVIFVYTTDDPVGPCLPTSGAIEAYFEDCSFASETQEILLYPNPANDQLKMAGKVTIDKNETYVTDHMGIRVNISWDNETINISKLPMGQYILHTVSTDGKNYRVRFVKE
jgi:hypothetical protein